MKCNIYQNHNFHENSNFRDFVKYYFFVKVTFHEILFSLKINKSLINTKCSITDMIFLVLSNVLIGVHENAKICLYCIEHADTSFFDDFFLFVFPLRLVLRFITLLAFPFIVKIIFPIIFVQHSFF